MSKLENFFEFPLMWKEIIKLNARYVVLVA